MRTSASPATPSRGERICVYERFRSACWTCACGRLHLTVGVGEVGAGVVDVLLGHHAGLEEPLLAFELHAVVGLRDARARERGARGRFVRPRTRSPRS